MSQDLIMFFPDADPEELHHLDNATEGFDEKQLQMFAAMYRTKRQSTQTILLTTLLGFIGLAGINRFLMDHKQFAKAFGAVTMQDIGQGLDPLIQFLRLDAGDSRFQ